MTADAICRRLLAATDELDELAGYVGDASISADVQAVSDDLHALRLQIEREALVTVPA